ncbi:MAG: DNA mismatch repair endonuclease MutL [Firmicutes bacterium]|uniref:DNA mismatch repair protein MutL n=1 Tax=Candidatus Colimorpha enterica TaxID=3083063 RepID=A0AAE3FE90_9BACT|nr:DNA mismatch repair endonuclease MutL [Candidatus Colimorpha enterica]
MGIINVLDTQVANLIAAGEVVERPASAVKELLENAIDAGAGKITLEIKNGGISLIRVTDDGCGMTKDDALVCVKRHATSKISCAADLDGIATLGFRGEALAAISSVSKMRIMTRTKNSPTGIIIEFNAGKPVSVEEAGCPEGTSVIVEELFANVPARRKFLKRDAAETAAVAAVAEKIALSRPDISLRFIADGNLRFLTAGDGKLADVIYAVLGRDFAKKLAPVHDMTEGVSVSGFIGTPENCRGNRNYENFFINGRYVRCKTACAALEQAFSSYIPSDKYPACVICLEINPAFVDVNVHPQKMEVKFSNERPVFNAVYCAVRNTLMNRIDRPRLADSEPTRLSGDSYRLYNDIISVKTDTDEEAARIADERERLSAKYEQITVRAEAKEPVPHYEPPADVPKMSADIPETFPAVSGQPQVLPDITVPQINDHQPPVGTLPDADMLRENVTDIFPAPMTQPESEPEPPAVPWYRIAGVIFNTYVFVELEDRMLIIDKHAAHERIIFEKLRQNMKSGDPASQLLLLPVELTLTPEELAAAEEYRDELYRIGYTFSCADDGKTALIIAYPSALDTAQAKDMFTVLAAQLADGTGDVGTSRERTYEKALYQASCKAAVKGGREDLPENIRWIAEQVLTRSEIRYCPHGRPVAFEMTKSQFEKRFERI